MMANNYESLKTDGHYTMARRIFTKIKSTFIRDVSASPIEELVPGQDPVVSGIGFTKTNNNGDDCFLMVEEGQNIDIIGRPDIGNAKFFRISATDSKVTQTATDSTNSDYEVLMSYSADNAERTEGARKTQHIKFNPFSKLLKLTGHLYDKWGLQTSRTMYEADFNNLAQAEKDNGTTYYIPDGKPLQICDYIYPVGAIYMSVNNISPAILFGGTWERIEDRFLLAAGSTYNSGATGGEAEHTLTTTEMPSHRHLVKNASGNNTLASSTNASLPDGPSWSFNDYAHDGSSGDGSSGKFYAWDAGGDQPHNNMPPYLVVNVWMRVPDPVQQEEEEGE